MTKLEDKLFINMIAMAVICVFTLIHDEDFASTQAGQISINSPNTPEAQVDIYQSGQSSTTLSMLIGANEGGAGEQE